jgi:hypothetical protein
MPAKSKAQQAMAAIALHNPSKLKDKSMLSMNTKDLRHFAKTPKKGLPKHKKKTGLCRLV